MADTKTNLSEYLKKSADYVNSNLKNFLPKDNSVISKAMRYSVMAGGKRLRPVFVILGAEIFGLKKEKIIAAACAVEYIHTYSLIHDDLPAMDNDDLRRGKPTSHKKFGEAAAILAGDALLTESFNLLAGVDVPGDRIVKTVKLFSEYSGYKGMIAGQAEDTIETGKWNTKNISLCKNKLEFIHINKTSALIKASLLAGAVLAGAKNADLKLLEKYAHNIGLAFQIADDILDVYADKKLLGKNGSDKNNGKLTYLSLYGKEKSEKKAKALINEAKKAVAKFTTRKEILEKLADYMIDRKY
ncbi:MAG: polyprenyl synthetase family protein [Endomicrobiaceae bacterium]|nr:polyprenyl synthetase family protein [Endomicrobiaceae bacterium]MDD3729528.1 polyprenyl synthetase family protein [Endomicrobiaceae bacterium]MDD4165450.1 polyprenyl synthetase family protein [Endomicrobiaceae bacterium]